MNKRIACTVLRMNLEREADRRAWEYLQRLDRKTYKSYSQAIIAAVNDFFDRQERPLNDLYLETREKEDAFLQRVLETIAQGLRETSTAGMAGEPPSFMQGITATNTASLTVSDAEREEAINAALDFVNSL